MIKIGLCDDIDLQLSMVADSVESYFQDNPINAKIFTYKSGEELLSGVDKDGECDIYFLDMILPGIKGIQLGEKLRERNITGKIIYLTATSEYAVDSYNVHAFYYMLKPISKSKIYDVLDKALKDILDNSTKDLSSKNDYYEIKTIEGKKVISSEDLNYVNINQRRLTYHMSDNSSFEGMMLRTTFADAVDSFAGDDSFRLLGQHLLINIRNVESLTSESLTFKNKETIYPPKSACTQLFEYLTKK